MYIYPAIDLRDGKVVRLTKGDYDRMEVYSSDPTDIARSFRQAGATHLHVVDLDGAKDGKLCNYDIISKLVAEDLFVEVGGGIRDEARIKAYLDAGVRRVILGSAAIENPGFAAKMAKKYGDAIAVGVDASEGKVAIHGWKTITGVDSLDFCEKLVKNGVTTVIYTDISKDGTLSGTNLEIYRQLSEIEGLSVIASGGITFEHEIATLREMNLHGAILGKALYTGKLDLSRAIAIGERGEVL
ncbi:MAG: 1-(5-phosphoribosyl)-5-[Clostridia bacterium]|nr:1-(5-phosphoribosyl)-5-[(5-phosphoribosylamino)methylideneamino]imidazole-4-carboxamide isomerase [Clostridia bacterium]